MKSSKFKLSIEHLWGLTALVGIFVFLNTHPIRPHDFWWHITIGREIVATGSIPAVDVYSYTAQGQPYPSYQMFWLMEVFLYGVFKLGGPALVVFLHSLLITTAYLVIFYLSRLASNSWRMAAFGVLFAAALGLNDWNVRPQGITFLLAAILLLVTWKYRTTSRWIWLAGVPLVMAIWSNSHGSFVIGLVILGICLSQYIWDWIKARLQSRSDHPITRAAVPALFLIAGMFACLVNPRGFGIISYVTNLTGNSVVRNLVTEWAPPKINTLMGAIFFTALLLSAVLLTISPRRPVFSHLLTFAIFGILALRTSRGIAWFGLVMAPILAGHISAIVEKYRQPTDRSGSTQGSPILNLVFTGMILVMGLITLPWFKSALPLPPAKTGLISAETPIQATDILLEESPPGQLFNAISFGSYLIWAGYPKYQVFVDSRIELFSEQVWLDYLRISNAFDGWDVLLDQYEVNTLMLNPVEQPALVQAAQESGIWHLIYRDGTAQIYTKVAPRD